MNNAKIAKLQDRVAVVGEKYASMLGAGSIPSASDMSFLDSCLDALTRVAPAHALRLIVADLRTQVADARAQRALFLKGRADALERAEATRQAKADARKAEVAAYRKGQKPTNAVARLIAEDLKTAAALPTGATAQGLEFVVELPLEWASTEEIFG